MEKYFISFLSGGSHRWSSFIWLQSFQRYYFANKSRTFISVHVYLWEIEISKNTIASLSFCKSCFSFFVFFFFFKFRLNYVTRVSFIRSHEMRSSCSTSTFDWHGYYSCGNLKKYVWISRGCSQWTKTTTFPQFEFDSGLRYVVKSREKSDKSRNKKCFIQHAYRNWKTPVWCIVPFCEFTDLPLSVQCFIG